MHLDIHADSLGMSGGNNAAPRQLIGANFKRWLADNTASTSLITCGGFQSVLMGWIQHIRFVVLIATYEIVAFP